MYGIELKPSYTYKLRSPVLTNHAIYFTIGGSSIPCIDANMPRSFFINSKEIKSLSFALMTAVVTQISRRLEEGALIEKVINDMKETFEPDGSYFLEDGTGRRVNSLIHHLGLILEQHVDERC
jgi:hypothetical protein